MKLYKSVLLLLVTGTVLYSQGSAQKEVTDRFEVLIGDWNGTGEGFSGNTSIIESSFTPIMDGRYLEIKNHSRFQPTEKYPEGETHMDQGIISYDRDREIFVLRQFNIEGYVNQYFLDEKFSTGTCFVFVSEHIENFVEGGRTKWTLVVQSPDSLETLFEVSFPGNEYVCFGTNKLWKRK